MASKQYISIIRLFDHCGISTGDDFNLPRVKKQLQAEFGIAQGGFIEVDGFTYSRHDVFEEIEQADFTQRLHFHKQIWNSPQILDLLEKSIIDLSTIKEEFKPFWSNKQFDIFFSPYFAGPFNYLSRTFLTDARLRDMGVLLSYEDFLQPAEREEAFRPIRIFLDENIRTLRNVNKENYKMMRSKFVHWIDTDWHLFFNNLPHEFYDEKNEITTRLVNIGVEIQKSHRRDCREMSDQLIAVHDAPESLRQIIVSNHAVYSRSPGGWGGGNIFWVLWVVFMLFRAVGSDGCGENKSDFKYSMPPNFNNIQVRDSILKILRDTNNKNKPDLFLK